MSSTRLRSAAAACRQRPSSGSGQKGSKSKPLDNASATLASSRPRVGESRQRSKSEAAAQKLAKPHALKAGRGIAGAGGSAIGARASQVREQLCGVDATNANKREQRAKSQSSHRQRPESSSDMVAYDALVEKQRSRMKSILSELQKHGQKTSCWAWYVFPTDKAGNCDPAKTRVTATNAARLFSGQAAGTWQCVLEKICELLEEKGMSVLPRIDHGRVFWFIKFWSELSESPEWMGAILRRLRKFPWPKV